MPGSQPWPPKKPLSGVRNATPTEKNQYLEYYKSRSAKPRPKPRDATPSEINVWKEGYTAMKDAAQAPKVNIPGGGPSNSGISRPAVPAGPDPLDALYASLTGSVKGIGKQNQGLYNAALKAIIGNYNSADQDIYNQYMGSRGDLRARAKNLGINIKNTEMGRDWDANMRSIQEMSNSNEVSDKNWVEKMRALDSETINYMIAGIKQELVDRKAAQAAARLAASYGGGRGSGGGGSSGRSSGSASEAGTINNVGDVELYNELMKVDPTAGRIFINNYRSNSYNPETSVGAILGQKSTYERNARMLQGFPFGFGSKARRSRSRTVNTSAYDRAMMAMEAISGNMGNPSYKHTTKQTGK